ncbi:MAG: heavy metal translocating P-type ATPase [Ruminococcus sp.]|nr:heavy metal translocating P-type ATPase [Ruminococcus sp.]
MERYDVKGMSCAACSSRVEKAVSGLEGVSSCSVNLLTNSMTVEGSATAEEIISAVEKAGYSSSQKGSSARQAASGSSDDSLRYTETLKIIKRLIASIVFLLVLMYFSMGGSMLGLPLPKLFEGNPAAVGIAQMLLAAAVMVINQKFFISGFKGLLHRAPNMDTLVALGSGVSFCYSAAVLFMLTKAQSNGDFATAESLMHEFYFESAAMILTLITVGKLLEARSKGKTTDAIKSLIRLSPKTAFIVNGEEETETAVENVQIGDIFAVRPGGSIPVDGVITYGNASVDESALTGESIPAEKKPGDKVSAGTINTSGYIRCKATEVGENTALSRIVKMVSEAAATKAPVAKLADRVSGIFVPCVLAIAAITAVVWLLVGKDVGFSLARAISVLVISCPCALGLATPVAIMVGSGVGARNGILFKNAVALEEIGKIKTVALDKTGTITVGKPVVTDILPLNCTENELLSLAYSLEKLSEHPLAKAIIAESELRNVKAGELEDFSVTAGNGLSGAVNGENVRGGNYDFVSVACEISADIKEKSDKLAEQGKTPIFFSKSNKIIGIIAVADVIKSDSQAAVAGLKAMGIGTVMLTGDNRKTAIAIGKQAGTDEVFAEVKPDGKESVISRLRASGKVAMVGDGINDAPALTSADIGIAIGAGTDIAIESADVVLMKSKLGDVCVAIRLGRATLRNIKENLFWAFIYNIIGIPLAAGVFIPVFGWQLNPMLGAAAMSLSSFCVVTNALRLNFARIYGKNTSSGSAGEDKNENKKENKDKTKDSSEIASEETEKEKTMTETIKIEGMMCPHCEASVKTALEELEEVESAQVSHKSGTAVVKLKSQISSDKLKSAIEARGYKVL